MGRAFVKAGLATVIMSLLVACGVRGNLEKPTSSVGAAEQVSPNPNSEGEAKSAATVAKPHQPSVLDGLLR